MDRADKGEARLDAALRRRLMADKATGADCPAPELLATYYDRTLPRAERDHFQSHLAECVRCQASLAAIARADDVDVSRSRESIWQSWMAGWRVAIPALAAMLVVFIVTGLMRSREAQRSSIQLAARANFSHPASAPEQLALNESKYAEVQPQAKPTAGPESQPNQPEIAGRELSKEATAAPVESAASPGASVPTLEAKAEQNRTEVPPRGAQFMTGTVGSGPRTARAISGNRMGSSTTSAMIQAGAPPEPIASEAISSPVAALRRESTAAQRSPAAAAAGAAIGGASFGVGGGAAVTTGGQLASNAIHPTSETSPSIVIGARQGRGFWRISNGNEVQFSPDGVAWRSEKLAVESQLLAGSAPSDTVCWVVGRNGTIIRTIDSVDWQKLAPPTNADLINVVAENADSAQVFAADGSSFLTSDGGRSWVRK